MIFLGLTEVQTEIVKSTALGESYLDISERLGIEPLEAMQEDIIASEILKKRWRKNEFDVRKAIRAMFLLFVCIWMSGIAYYDNSHVNIADLGDDIQRVRTRTRTRSRTRIDMSDDDSDDIILNPVRDKTC